MPYVDDDEPPGAGFHGARPGVSAADLAFDEPGAAAPWGGSPQGAAGFGDDDGAGAAAGFADEPPTAGWDEPPLWPVLGGGYFRLPAPVWGRWRGRPRLHRSLGSMLGNAHRVGTLRHRGSGARFPVYRASAGRQSWRVVGRPRGRNREMEIVALQPELGAPQSELEAQGELEAFPADAAAFRRPARYGAAPRYGRAPLYGDVSRYDSGRRYGGLRYGVSRSAPRVRRWRLRLPHRGLHTVMARLRPDQLRGLAGGHLPADPAPAVIRAVAGLARRARPAGRLSGGFTVFATPGWRLLVRPLGELQGEIVAVRPVEGEEEVIARGKPGFERTLAGTPYRVRGAQATVAWSAAVPVEKALALKPAAAAVYVLMRDGVPIYVGESGSWAVRWRGRFQALSEFGVPLAPYTVAVGNVSWTGPAPAPPPDLLRNDVESILIRAYGRAGVKLNNRTATKRILPAPQGFRVQSTGAVPPRLPAAVADQGQTTPFELGGDPLGR